ncbi:MAG: glycosyltransferase family 2 protein [Desulfovibrionaceae bacterium]|nr:glycosyltransferase family 2 protein [Desulfovibrionaceae bacterium]
MPQTVTGLVLTYNGERLLDECLRSLDFCDQVLVVDSQSTDRTADIARARGARLDIHAWPGPVAQFRRALGMVTTDWVVSLDQDEMLSPKLRQSVIQALGQERIDPDLAGFYVNRRSFYFNRFMKHSGWYPDRLFRVFRTRSMEVSAQGAHYRFRPLGPAAGLAGDIIHHPYSCFREHMDKINYYAEQAAEEMRGRGARGGLARALVHAKVRFVKLYLLKAGFLDGRAGLINAAFGAFYAFQKYIRVNEARPWTGKGGD